MKTPIRNSSESPYTLPGDKPWGKHDKTSNPPPTFSDNLLRLTRDVTPPTPQEPMRMTFKYKKQNATPALTLKGITLINFGEILTLVGLPGQGKTAICEAIVCASLGEDEFGFVFHDKEKKVLLIDTERPFDDVSDSYNNIARRLGSPKLDDDGEIDRLQHLALADFGKVNDLKSALETELVKGSYSLVVLDGIIDFALSMNDDEDATNLVKWLRSLAVAHNVAVVCTIHPNKNSEVIAGHLGAFLYRWARAILFIRSHKDDKSIKELTGESEMAKLSHGDLSKLGPVYFTWDEGRQLLMPCEFVPQVDRGKGEKMRLAFTIVLTGDKRFRHKELITALMNMGHSERTATRWVKAGVEEGILNHNSAIYSLVK